MIHRDIYKHLVNWRKESIPKPILLRGARQVGKSFIVNAFGTNEFDNIITINFERNPEYKELFTTIAPKVIIERIMLLSGREINTGTTLLFFDEIQECPKAITSLRYFYEEIPGIHIIGAGSLLEFSLRNSNFKMPVGRIQYLFMHPLSFNEFLGALGETYLQKFIADFNNIKNIDPLIHNKLTELVRTYFILGGMPAVIAEYVENANILRCQKIQRSIIDTYLDDFGKYSKATDFMTLRKLFYSAAKFTGEKFVYARVDNTQKTAVLKNALNLLELAGVLIKIKRSTGDGIPLESNVKENFFKILFLDIGLMNNINGSFNKLILEKDLSSSLKGSVAEQFVGQQLICHDNPWQKTALFYWAREAKNSSAEIDYLVEHNGFPLAIEVKSGNIKRMKSIRMFMDKYKPPYSIRVSQNTYCKDHDIYSTPFYGINSFLQSDI